MASFRSLTRDLKNPWDDLRRFRLPGVGPCAEFSRDCWGQAETCSVEDSLPSYLDSIREGHTDSVGHITLDWAAARRKYAVETVKDPQQYLRFLFQFVAQSNPIGGIKIDYSFSRFRLTWAPQRPIDASEWASIPARLLSFQLPRPCSATYYLERGLQSALGLSLRVHYPEIGWIHLNQHHLTAGGCQGGPASICLELEAPERKHFVFRALDRWPEYLKLRPNLFSLCGPISENGHLLPTLPTVGGESRYFGWLLMSANADENQLAFQFREFALLGFQAVDLIGNVLETQPGGQMARCHSLMVINLNRRATEEFVVHPYRCYFLSGGRLVHQHSQVVRPGLSFYHAGCWDMDLGCSTVADCRPLNALVQLYEHLTPKFLVAFQERLENPSLSQLLRHPFARALGREWLKGSGFSGLT